MTSELFSACAEGRVKLYRQRANGTSRRIPWLTEQEREYATYIQALHELGYPYPVIAKDCQMSTSAARRLVLNLELQDAIAAGDYDDIYQPGVTSLYFG